MDIDTFWRLVEDSLQHSPGRRGREAFLRDRLASLPLADGFVYFRLWLVGRGRDVFERAVAQPDALAEFPEIRRLVGRHCRTWNSDEEWPEWESLDYLASEAYGRATGDDDECAEGFYDAVKAQLSGEVFSRDPAGERWDARDETVAALKVPTLTRMFGLDTLR